MVHPMTTEKKVALVTGASAGIGKAVVRRLLKDGWIVYGGTRRIRQMADIASGGARVLALDITDDHSMSASVEPVLNAEARIDALVNNAAYGSYGAAEDVPISQARRQFEVNYLKHWAMSGAKIAFLLGFEDPNSFVRAFQSWSGNTPERTSEHAPQFLISRVRQKPSDILGMKLPDFIDAAFFDAVWSTRTRPATQPR